MRHEYRTCLCSAHDWGQPWQAKGHWLQSQHNFCASSSYEILMVILSFRPRISCEEHMEMAARRARREALKRMPGSSNSGDIGAQAIPMKGANPLWAPWNRCVEKFSTHWFCCRCRCQCRWCVMKRRHTARPPENSVDQRLRPRSYFATSFLGEYVSENQVTTCQPENEALCGRKTTGRGARA